MSYCLGLLLEQLERLHHGRVNSSVEELFILLTELDERAVDV